MSVFSGRLISMVSPAFSALGPAFLARKRQAAHPLSSSACKALK